MTTNIEDEATIAKQEALREGLEKLVDASSLHAVLFALSGVCIDKGEHIRGNWQDKHTADDWYFIALKVDAVGDKARDLGI